MTRDPSIIAYEATPAAVAEAQVVWRGDGFSATLPPRGDRRVVRAIMMGAGVSGTGAFWACMMVSSTLVFATDTGIIPPMRVLFATISAVTALGLGIKSLQVGYRVLRTARQARMSARIAVEGEMLVLEVPDVIGVCVTRLRLTTIASAAVRRTARETGERVDLLIEGPNHRGKPLFNDTVYRAADLNAVATAIRAAIIKQTSGL